MAAINSTVCYAGNVQSIKAEINDSKISRKIEKMTIDVRDCERSSSDVVRGTHDLPTLPRRAFLSFSRQDSRDSLSRQAVSKTVPRLYEVEASRIHSHACTYARGNRQFP